MPASSTSATVCAVAFKIESHNHPSFIEPFQGAATGVGGILRDIFTMGARPIAAMNSLRFGPLDQRRRTAASWKASSAGSRIYGNASACRRSAAKSFSTSCYSGNPLVNAFALGIFEKDQIFYGRAHGRRQSRDLCRREDRTRRHSRRDDGFR